MRNFLAGIVLVLVLEAIGAVAFIYSGIFDVAATTPHWPVTYWVLDTARVRSIEAHAAGIAVPAGLGDQAKLVMGTEHFAAHCAVCHGAPGVEKSEIGKGMYPRPPDLAHAATHLGPAELYWIIKNGIKMSGMPSWADHSDEELWATVAFLQKLPGMTQEEYAKLVMASMAHGGDRHGAGEATPATPTPPAQQSPAAHAH